MSYLKNERKLPFLSIQRLSMCHIHSLKLRRSFYPNAFITVVWFVLYQNVAFGNEKKDDILMF